MTVDLSLTQVTSAQQALFGAGNSWGNVNSAYVLVHNGKFRVDYIGSQTLTIDAVVGERYLLDCKDTVVSINGNAYSTTVNKNVGPLKEMYFFNENNNGNLVGQAKMRLYFAAVYLDGTTLDAMYIPCVKDGVAGLYNTVDGSIIYGEAADKLVASETPNPEFRLNGTAIERNLSVTQKGAGGTTSMAAENWAAPGSAITLSATPDAGMKAVWFVTDKFGAVSIMTGSTVTLTMGELPLSAELTFAPEEALTPADNISAAISAAPEGSVIKLSSGTFPITGTLVLDKEITVKGAGVEDTIIKMPTKGDFTAVEISHDNAILEDVTLTGVNFVTKPTTAASGGTYNGSGHHTANKPLGVKISKGTFRNSVVRDNYATLQYGYGIWTDMTGGTVANVRYLDNYYNRSGNQVWGYVLRMSGGVVTNSEFARNGCTWEENGAVTVSGGLLVDSSIHDNDGVAPNYHGGVYVSGGGKVERCRIFNNNNGLYISGGTVANCLIYGNGKAGNNGYYAGVYQAGGTFVFNTVYGNISDADASGISGIQMTGGTARNNIFFGNGPAGSTAGSVRKTGGTFEYNLTDIAVPGNGNLVGTPAFADPANADFSLKIGSCAAAIGTPVASVTDDFTKAIRPATPSAGAYEYSAGTELACGIKIGSNEFKEGSPATLTAIIEGAESPSIQWYVDGVLSSETSATPSFEALAPGFHTVKLVVTDGENTVEKTVTNAFTVKPATVYVATDSTPVYPYATPETAANSIVDAIPAVYSDDETAGRIIVAAGIFKEPGTITLSRPVEVVGAGRDVTVISGVRFNEKGRGAYLANARAMLKDLTITGCTNKSYGVGVYLADGILDNVHITRSYQRGDGDNYNRGAGVLMEKGIITNSLIDYCYLNATYHGSQGVGVWMSGGLLVDSEVANNWMTRTQHNGIGVYAKGGTVSRCRIHHNYSTSNHAGASGAQNVSSGHGMNLSGSVLVEDTVIYSNGWNGVMMTGGTLQNSLIFGHRAGTADFFAGVNMTAGNLINCTITDNASTGDTNGKSGLWMTGGTAVNNIIYGNGKKDLGSTCVTGGTFKTNIVDKATAYAAASEITVADPKFVSEYDFHIQNGSEAVDNGAPLLFHDLDGIARPQRNGHDIGCYELPPSTERTVAISAPQTSYMAGSVISASASLENIDAESAIYSWTLSGPDGAVLDYVSGTGTDYAAYTSAKAVLGDNSLNLVVTDNGDQISASEPVRIKLMPITVYVSQAGSCTPPFATPETATTNISEALSATWQSLDVTTTVYVASGEYSLENGMMLAMPVWIIGDGRDKTIINCASMVERAVPLTVNNSSAIVSGLTIEGSTNRINYGSSVRLYDGTLDSVRITRGYLSHIDSVSHQGVGLYQSGGVATNCVIDRNGCGTGYGDTRGVGLKITNGLFTDGIIASNVLNRGEYHGAAVCVEGGTVRRSLILENSGWHWGNSYGTIYVSGSGIVEDCEIIGDNSSNGVHVENGGTVRNSLITRFKETQKVGNNGAAGLVLVNGKVINCTIAGNETTVEGEMGDFAQAGGTARNNIALEARVAGGVQDHNIFNTDPKFKVTKKCAFLLSENSPARDAGDNSAWTWGNPKEAFDLSGKGRVTNGTLDCGAFEYHTSGIMLMMK